MKNTKVNNRWLKAAIIGSLWASIEILLGSFLHNLRVPFTGPILASIGVFLIVLCSQSWYEKGLIIRAGLICAIMKSISPSAFILGPMVGILFESIILELFISFLGRNLFGYMIAGAIAVSTTLVQNIVGLIITYGFNLVELYVKIIQFLNKSIGTNNIGPMDLVLFFLILEVFLGIFMSVSGFYLSKKIMKVSHNNFILDINESNNELNLLENTETSFSLFLLCFHFICIVVCLLISNFLTYYVTIPIIFIYILISFIYYRTSLNRLKKPKIWIEFTIIIILTGFLMGGIKTNSFYSWEGVIVGFEMVSRASLIIVGFSIISIELRNPVIINFLFKKGMGQLYLSLDLAFETLPIMTANLLQQKKIFRQPILTVARLMHTINLLYEKYKGDELKKSNVFILTGDPNSGKTTLLNNIVSDLKISGLRVGGIIAPGLWRANQKQGFEIINLKTGEKQILCNSQHQSSKVKIGKFNFSVLGLSFGFESLNIENLQDVDIVVIDEIGNLELKGEGWSKNLDILIKEFNKPILLVVRKKLINEICLRWNFQPLDIWEVGKVNLEEIILKLKKYL